MNAERIGKVIGILSDTDRRSRFDGLQDTVPYCLERLLFSSRGNSVDVIIGANYRRVLQQVPRKSYGGVSFGDVTEIWILSL